jgi:DNA modification methylase
MKPQRPDRPDRRSLTHVGGQVTRGGSHKEAALLAHALDVPPPPPRSDRTNEGEGRAHVHGFHAYPARMHPVTAARLVEDCVPAGGTVLDPFCGSGTVLVEAQRLGRSAVGTDLNPLAIALSRAKTRARAEGELEALVGAAKSVAAFADQRRRDKVGATRRFGKEDTEAFDPHVLLEMDSLRHGVRTVVDDALQGDLMLVLSAIIVKVSRKESDTSTAAAPKRIAAGYPARLFVKKTEELVERLRELGALLPTPRPDVRVAVDDATRLDTIEDGSIDGVVTSPPYVATYDYLAHHALRLRWLGFDADDFEANELGARRAYAGLRPHDAWDRWANELHALLMALARVTRRGGAIVLLMADSAVEDAPLLADEIIFEVAGHTPLVCVARASQPRPHFHLGTRDAFRLRSRAEHALLLRRS